jgi:hypothetical protein
METRNSRGIRAHRLSLCVLPHLSLDFRVLIFVTIAWISAALIAAGCGAPGEPTPPSPLIPVPITDLAATQAGDGVQLTFTLPSKTTNGERLADAPAVEILRGDAKPNGSPDAKSFRVVQTIPGALVNNYRSEDRVQLVDQIPPDQVHSYSGGIVLYRVRTRASRKRSSEESNIVTVHLLPVAERLATVQAKVAQDAVELSWAAPTRNSSGEPPPAISEYHVYRGEVDTASGDNASVETSAQRELSQIKWKSPIIFLGSSNATTYRDTTFEFGKTYAYTVRSETQPEGHPLESSDSVPVIVTPRDVFPPARPEGLSVSVIVASPTNAPEVDLSWSINSEPDLAGYRVYRSERQDTRGDSVTPDLLLSPAYRDTSVQPGHRYWYRVTSVDRSGNESAPCEPILADLTQPST